MIDAVIRALVGATVDVGPIAVDSGVAILVVLVGLAAFGVSFELDRSADGGRSA